MGMNTLEVIQRVWITSSSGSRLENLLSTRRSLVPDSLQRGNLCFNDGALLSQNVLKLTPGGDAAQNIPGVIDREAQFPQKQEQIQLIKLVWGVVAVSRGGILGAGLKYFLFVIEPQRMYADVVNFGQLTHGVVLGHGRPSPPCFSLS